MIRRTWLTAGFLVIAIGFAAALFVQDGKAAAQAQGGGLQAGTACTVFFRGDAAGQAVQSYVGSVNNNASLAGTLTSIDDQWIVLSKEKKTTYIPRAAVLMVQVSEK